MVTKVNATVQDQAIKLAAAPTTGTYTRGDVVWNSEVGTGDEEPTGWVCVIAGTPGTWESFGTRYLEGSLVYDFPAITAGSYASINMTVAGAAVGDFVSLSLSLTQLGGVLTGYVTTANIVTCILFNPTASVLDLASATIYARVSKRQ